jgi:hypothetical protein
MRLDALLKKKADLEELIAAARTLEKRRAGLADMLEKAGALALTDDEIIAAVKVALGKKPVAAEPKKTADQDAQQLQS